MLKECELYCHGDLILDKEELIGLNIQKTNVIGIISLLQSHSNLFEIKNGEVTSVDKNSYLTKIMNSKKEICYISRGGNLFLPIIEVYYGIEDSGRVLSVYREKNVRDAKLSYAVMMGQVNSIVEDMGNSRLFIQDYSKQKKLRNIYDGLTFRK